MWSCSGFSDFTFTQLITVVFFNARHYLTTYRFSGCHKLLKLLFVKIGSLCRWLAEIFGFGIAFLHKFINQMKIFLQTHFIGLMLRHLMLLWLLIHVLINLTFAIVCLIISRLRAASSNGADYIMTCSGFMLKNLLLVACNTVLFSLMRWCLLLRMMVLMMMIMMIGFIVKHHCHMSWGLSLRWRVD